jgi:hypothetical protein
LWNPKGTNLSDQSSTCLDYFLLTNLCPVDFNRPKFILLSMKQIAFAVTFAVGVNSFGAPEHLLDLRERTRLLVNTRHCANCHTPDLPTAKAGALHVYDLSQPYWSAAMNDRQVKDFKRRIENTLSPAEVKVMGGSPKEKPLSHSQRKLVDDFVKEELAYRKSAPGDRFREQQTEMYPEIYKLIEGK